MEFQEKLRVISISSNRGTTVAVTKEGNIYGWKVYDVGGVIDDGYNQL